MRQGAVAVYLDVWHRDLPEFLQLRTNNGDDRMKAHDVFPAVCYPDLFWKMAKEDMDQNWYLMCPHEIFQAKGYHLEDYFGEEWERRYLDCVQDAVSYTHSIQSHRIISHMDQNLASVCAFYPNCMFRRKHGLYNPITRCIDFSIIRM